MKRWRLIMYSPAYNVRDSITELMERMRAVAAGLSGSGVDLASFIVVDDGSTDGTAAALDAERKRTDFLRVRHKPANQGVVAAIFDGMRLALEAGGSDPRTIIVRMDTDLEHQPEDLGRLIEPIIGGKTRASVGYTEFDSRYGLPLRVFNSYAGRSESRRFLGLDMPQFCPGFHAVRADLFQQLLPLVEAKRKLFRKLNGKDLLTLDVVLLALAKRLGEPISQVRLSPVQERWIKKQPMGKLLSYLDYHWRTVRFLESEK